MPGQNPYKKQGNAVVVNKEVPLTERVSQLVAALRATENPLDIILASSLQAQADFLVALNPASGVDSLSFTTLQVPVKAFGAAITSTLDSSAEFAQRSGTPIEVQMLLLDTTLSLILSSREVESSLRGTPDDARLLRLVEDLSNWFKESLEHLERLVVDGCGGVAERVSASLVQDTDFGR